MGRNVLQNWGNHDRMTSIGNCGYVSPREEINLAYLQVGCNHSSHFVKMKSTQKNDDQSIFARKCLDILFAE